MKQSIVRRVKENTLVRILTYPFEQIRRRARLAHYQKCEDAKYIHSLKNTHNGEMCFVIGNGPSLRPEDLDILHERDIFCFGANRIFKIFPKTQWRPTYYLALDTFLIADEIDNIKTAGLFPKIINYNSVHFGRAADDNIHYLCVYEPFKINPFKMTANTLSEDPSLFSIKTATVTVSAIELAIYMGFKTIYLLGVDHNYSHKRQADGTVVVDPTIKSYFQGGDPGKNFGFSVQPVEYMTKAYEIARPFAEERGVTVCNATRGGKLEVFERVNFDDLMK